ncbi:undecaprenyl-diphosphatase [Bogoriella caseilytica]|uniref:Undecaprenyl-diphosphatase n=1 Tax=Bogoriella caseilytica TaxID=56055 RepID=A0A3N2B928_9MICO|nr:undecaprenyl-diphosphatase [Bogoriella caseilytica]
MSAFVTWWEVVVLGLLQGLTEFLPISSSAHLRIAGEMLPSGNDPGAAFTAITQLGTEAAVILYFRKDIARIISHWFRSLPIARWHHPVSAQDPDARMGWFVIAGSVPIAVLGLALESYIDHALRNLYITAAMLALFGLVLGYADMTSRRVRTLDTLTWKHALTFGFAQALALIPGVSRSGATISAGLMLGYTREAATRYAFLLAIPAVTASGLYKLFGDVIFGEPVETAATVSAGGIVVATVISFVVGYAVTAWLLSYISTHSYAPFVLYRLGLAVIVVILLLTGVVDPLASGPGTAPEITP